jgi:hypothetical protein
VDKPFFWIQPHVLARLQTGQFVPHRSSQLGALRPSKPNLTQDRRADLSPLAVAKRCIKYQPLVFLNRLSTILEWVEVLNTNDNTRLLTLEGSSGSGKTALIRGLVELMGGGPEQLLWLSLNLLSNPSVVLHLLAQQILALTPLHHHVILPIDPLLALNTALEYFPKQPLVVVLDGLEYWLDTQQADQGFLPSVVQSAITALLGLPQLKLIVIAPVIPSSVKRLGYPQQTTYSYYLQPLGPQSAKTLLKVSHKLPDEPLSGLGASSFADTTMVWPDTMVSDWGLPGCLQLVGKLHRLGVITPSVNSLFSAKPSQWLPTALSLLWVNLGQTSKLLLLYLTCLPVGLFLDAKALWMLLQTHPGQEALHSTLLADGLAYSQQLLKAPLVSPLLRMQLMPQQALLTLQSLQLAQSCDQLITQQVAYQLHPLVHHAMVELITGWFTVDDLAQCHIALAGYYLQQAQVMQQAPVVAVQWCHTTVQQLLTQHQHHKALAQQYFQGSTMTSTVLSKPLQDATLPLVDAKQFNLGSNVANWSIKSYLAKQ